MKHLIGVFCLGVMIGWHLPQFDKDDIKFAYAIMALLFAGAAWGLLP